MNTRTRRALAIVLVMTSAILLAGVAKKVFAAEEGSACAKAYGQPATPADKAYQAGLAFVASTGHFGMYEATEEDGFSKVRGYSPYAGDHEFLLDAETWKTVDTEAVQAPDGWDTNPRVFAYCAGEEPELIAVGQEK